VISEGATKGFGTIKTELAEQWKCPTCPKAMIHYRQKIKRLLTEDNDDDPSGFVYFAEVLVGYIKKGGADYN
jgi:hypothetical protein